MQTKNQLFAIIASSTIIIFCAAIIAQAVTTVGNDVSIGGALTVTGTSTLASTLYVNKATGRVGIGTSTPIQELEVIGDINLNTNGTDALFSTYQGANSDGYNIFIGGGGQSSVGDVAYTPYGSYNTAVGIDALLLNTLGENNTANGYYSLYDNTTGNSNTANGVTSLSYNTTGNYNTGSGSFSLNNNKTGSNNVAMGYSAGYGVDNSSNISNSVLLGYEAGKALLTAGSNNILIGYKAGDTLTTGSKNIVIGYDIDAPAVTSVNTLNIGNLIYATGLDGSGTTLSAGNVGIGTTTPPSLMSIYNASATSTLFISSGTLPGEIILKDTIGNACTRITTYAGAIKSEVATCPRK